MKYKKTDKIAMERIRILFDLAEETFHEDPELAQRYIDLARKIAMRTRLHIPKELRLKICRKCKGFLVPSVTSRIRIKKRREPHVAITCLRCNHVTRIPIRRREN